MLRSLPCPPYRSYWSNLCMSGCSKTASRHNSSPSCKLCCFKLMVCVLLKLLLNLANQQQLNTKTLSSYKYSHDLNLLRAMSPCRCLFWLGYSKTVASAHYLLDIPLRKHMVCLFGLFQHTPMTCTNHKLPAHATAQKLSSHDQTNDAI